MSDRGPVEARELEWPVTAAVVVAMRLRLLAPAVACAFLTVPAAGAAAADCPDTASFRGSLRSAEFTGGGGPLGPRKLTVGEPVEGRRVDVGSVYYVPKGHKAVFKLHGYRQRASGGTVFLVQCDIWEGDNLYFRLLEGKVKVRGGKTIPQGADGSPPGSYVVTPEATMLPLPGRPRYTATRHVTDKRSTTRSSVGVARKGSNMFVKVNAAASAGKKVPCQAGARITVFGNGRYSNG